MNHQRIIKIGRSQSQIQQGRALRNIRNRAAQIHQIMMELATFESCMSSPNDSPIKVNNKSSSGQNISQIQQFINKKQPVRDQIKEEAVQFKKTMPSSKQQTCSVHFTNYMKPIGKLTDKCKNILEQQRKAKEEEQLRQQTLLKQSKQKSTKFYKNVPPRYNTTNDRKVLKEDVVLNSQLQKEQKQLAGATFSPTINKNYRVQQPFEIRMQINKIKKSQKEGVILKSAMKEETYTPKINSKNMIESKVKKLWSKSSRNTSQLIGTTSRSLQYIEPQMRSRVKVTKASDLNFIIQQI